MNKKIKLSHFINRLGCGDEILYCSRVYIHARLYGGAWIWMEWCINFVFYFIRGHKNHVRRAYLWERRYHAKAKIQNIEDSTSEKKTPPVGNETPPDANETLIEEGVPEMRTHKCAQCKTEVDEKEVIIRQFYNGRIVKVEYFCSNLCHHQFYLARLNKEGL